MVVKSLDFNPVFQHDRNFREWNIGGIAWSAWSGRAVTPFGR